MQSTYIPRPSIAIFVNPRTTYPELKQCMKQIKKHYNWPIKGEDGKWHAPKMPSYIPRVADYHAWHWSRIKGMTYAKIANEWVDAHPNDDKIGEIEVLKGVKKYRSLLVR